MGRRLLLVEDDASVREAATIVLERAGFSVHGVADGREALATVASRPPFDVIVLDLMLPSMSGFDVCRELRTTAGVPIVMLTARDDTADVVAGLELGADDYVTKPFEPAELAARIRAVLRRSAEAAPAGHVSSRDLVVDVDAFRAFRQDEEIDLTAMEF